jgi:hypothetical protein
MRIGQGGGPNVRRQRLLNRVRIVEDQLEQLCPDLILDGLEGHIRLAWEQVQLVHARLEGEV